MLRIDVFEAQIDVCTKSYEKRKRGEKMRLLNQHQKLQQTAIREFDEKEKFQVQNGGKFSYLEVIE